MLDHSSNNSSNLFALSSESSRSDLRKSKKNSYSSFVKKVKSLMEAEGDDLQELYRKVEIIVKKYFDQHQIVQFGEMYNHIIALKANSSKMNKLVDVLEKKIILEQSLKIKKLADQKKSDRSDDFEITSSTHKQRSNKEKNNQSQSRASKFNDHIKQIEQSAISSGRNYFSPKIEKETRLKDQKKKKYNRYNQSSPSKSPSKLNSSFEEYQSRNRKYQEKVKELMSQLSQIKSSLSNPNRQTQTQSQRSSFNLKQELKIRLEESNHQIKQIKEQDPKKLIKYQFADRSVDKRNKMNETRQSQSLSINRQSFSIQIMPQNQKQKLNISSQKTIGQHPPQNEEKIIQKQKLEDKRSGERKKILLNQANSITKQLQQLKQVAQMLQIDSTRQLQQINKNRAEIQNLSSETKIIQLTRPQNYQNISRQNQERKKRQATNQMNVLSKKVLQRISNTSSKVQITQENIPSFKQFQEKDKRLETSIQANIIQGSSKIPDNSVFSFSNTYFSPQIINQPQINYPHQSPLPAQQKRQIISSPYILTSPFQKPVSLAVSNVKQGFIPLRQQRQFPNQFNHHPQIRYQEDQRPPISIVNSNKSALVSKPNNHISITMSQSHMPERKQGLNILYKQKGSTQKNRYSHLKSNQQKTRSESGTKVRFINSSLLQNPSYSSLNSSNSSFRRKGLNMMLSPSMK